MRRQRDATGLACRCALPAAYRRDAGRVVMRVTLAMVTRSLDVVMAAMT